VANEPLKKVVGLIDGDAIDPGAKAAVPTEMIHVAKDLQEYFLDYVPGVGGVIEQPPRKVVNRCLEPADQSFVSAGLRSLECGDQRLIFQVCLLLGRELCVKVQRIIGHGDLEHTPIV